MNAYKCDRCGGYYTAQSENWDKIHIMKSHYNGVIKGKTYFDLCPDCMNCLREWLSLADSQPDKGADK